MPTSNISKRIESIASECGGTVSVAVRGISNAPDFAVNESDVVSSASIIKVPMMVEAMRQASEGILSLDAEHVLTDDQRVRGSGIVRYLHAGAALTVKDLIWLMIIVSDNTATNIIMDMIGIENVNATMRRMGITATKLERKMYDWQATERGLDNVCTAREITDLLVRIATGKAVGGEWDELMMDIMHHQQDTGRLGMLLPEEAKLANKTGSREGVFHDCGVVGGHSFSYALSVFCKDARSQGDAQWAIARVSRAVYDCVSASAAAIS